MQPLTWYLRRLRSMSATEIAWRIRSAMRDQMDRYRFALGMIPAPRIAPCTAAVRLCDVPLAAWMKPEAGNETRAWRDRLVQKADEIQQHKLSFFDLKSLNLGNPIDWHRDHASGKPAPRIFAQSIDYRDFRTTGDCKLVWEPNRHHQFVVLGRAYRATGDTRYARAIAEQMEAWMEQNPFGKGMNWRSPLELGIRLINWVWALDLIHDSGLFEGAFRERVLKTVYLHCWEIARKYSRGSSANNHLVGEAAGIYVATAYFPELPGAARWQADARAILLREIRSQTYADGCTREQALGYEFFVLQFYLFCGFVADRIGQPFPHEYWSSYANMLVFVGRLAEGGDHLPLFGDCDDGYVLDLGDEPHDARAQLCIGAIHLGRADFKSWSDSICESAYWLFGDSARQRFDQLPGNTAEQALQSHGYTESGYYLLQHGTRGSSNRISVLFDCGELGQGSIAAHGHADALSFTLRVAGVDVLVDPGTYDYFSFPAWRRYFRSTQAHNCLALDGADQSLMQGPFMWGARATARCTMWKPANGGGTVTGVHDGYRHLASPALHQRSLTLDGVAGELSLRDEIESSGKHAAALHFHFSEFCTVSAMDQNRCAINVAGKKLILELDPALTMELHTGSENPILGWTSRGYHRKLPTTTVVGRANCQGSTAYTCRILIT